MDPEDYKVCPRCNKSKSKEKSFYMRNDGGRVDICKECLTRNIDNKNPETFLWILEMLDVPYVEAKWIGLVNKHIGKGKPLKPNSILGTYLRTMRLGQWCQFRYADSDRLNFADQKAAQESAAAAQDTEEEKELRRQLEAGEISQAQYDTLSRTVLNIDEKPTYANDPYEIAEGLNLLEQLTQEDIQHLSLRWGTLYRPEQWIKMETMYNKYAAEYDLNVDREEVLIKMCKTSLKMDECLDAGDVQNYKNLAAVFDQLRKSGKFTEAQNKEEKTEFLNTIGELVLLCEQHGGPIQNNLPDPDEYPQDKIDFSIKDLKAYTRSLVADEPHMQDLIESFIQKYEAAEETELQLDQDFILTDEDEAAQEVTQEEELEYQQFLENEIAADAEALLMEFGDEDES